MSKYETTEEFFQALFDYFETALEMQTYNPFTDEYDLQYKIDETSEEYLLLEAVEHHYNQWKFYGEEENEQ